ncbi:hypothetical protein ON010_g16943 [Phytophthora cinnamomi]|nr:hypothetical protein ON010_g16943 [Phytophthora cinnamomi]
MDLQTPAGLSNDFFYIRPGKSKKGMRGDDFFVGELELMYYLDRLVIGAVYQKPAFIPSWSNVCCMVIEELKRHKQKQGEAYSQAIVAQNNPDVSTQTSGETAESRVGTKASDERSNTAPSAPESPGRSHELISTPPHVMRDDASDSSTHASTPRESHSTTNPSPQHNRNNAFITTVDDDSIAAENENYTNVDWVEPDPGSEDEATTAPDLLFDPALLGAVGGVGEVARGVIRTSVLDDMHENGWTIAKLEDYPGIFDGDHGPTAGTLNAASTALGAFLRLVTPRLLEKIAEESNDYFIEILDARVEAQHTKQQARQLRRPTFQAPNPQQIMSNLQKSPDISGRELCIYIGLLIARTIVPNKEKFAYHWKTTDEGALPRGRFGQFMKRDQFDHISRNLHFSSNSDVQAEKLCAASSNYV